MDADEPEILVTNDDGIDAPGIRALADGLDAVGNVTVVAPADNQSATGRAMSQEVAVHDHDLGYAIEGTPADCVVAGLEALGPYPDLVVSGVNEGGNLGMYVLGRSGTVSAAVEAAFFGVPAIAVSMYMREEQFGEPTAVADYEHAVDATTHLAHDAVTDGIFDTADYLNVNAPHPDADATGEMVVTRPSHAYDMTAAQTGDTVTLYDRLWEAMAAGDIHDPDGTDRRAVLDGHVSVSPLTAPHSTEHHDALDGIATEF
ncbi:5'/3'-nucleotidase SurE [Halobacterium salinarum]|uniref:5'/3'-nucleotidase SurE n=1 Tax=Halobacterium salinarum TaxID=2242 RepID=UPI001F442C2B|nr:5'/3'-nucleotidase SurE [Halobacterium salinarum]MCF2165112.1 5'/3'-nucleotidase SurE [Halobacterium salinarum]MCF2168079.1 5'/3'-nucleotidase SurE [Halobacterium salinarum]MCF2208542.1 5'/3'-nucleotidase SurE [Halobacterium salinarum]MCF2238295.1 5'/3'-nucleotidase SurE [Halobacterium salinarum]MCF2241859.1 5'/3'-nucleotidase SurE [Halobacterium salinarum]